MVDSEFARQLERERNAAIDALQYIAHSGLSARHLSKFALEFLNDKSLCPSQNDQGHGRRDHGSKTENG